MFEKLTYRILSLAFMVMALTSTIELNSQNICEFKYLGKAEGVPEVDVRLIERDGDGNFYLLSQNKLGRYDGMDIVSMEETFTKDGIFLSQINEMNLLHSGEIVFSIPGMDDTYFIKSGGREVNKIRRSGYPMVGDEKLYYAVKTDTSNTAIFRYPELKSEERILIANNLNFSVQKIYEHQGKIYAQDNEENIYCIDKNVPHLLGQQGTLIGTGNTPYIVNSDGIFKITKDTIEQIYSYQKSKKFANLITTNQNGQLLVGFSDKPRYTSTYIVVDSIGNIHDLSFMSIYADKFRDIFSDDYLSRWLGASYTGLYVIGFEREGLSFVYKDESKALGEYGSLVTSIVNLPDERLFLCKEGLDVLVYDTKDSSLVSLMDKMPYKFNQNLQYYYDQSSELLYGLCYTYDTSSTLVRLDPEKPSLVDHLSVPYKFTDIIYYAPNKCLLGGHNSRTKEGVFLSYDFEFESYEVIQEGGLSVVTCLYHDEEREKYWVGTIEGLYVYDEEWGLIDHFHHSAAVEKNIFYDYINDVKAINNVIVVGSNGGGFYFIDRTTMEVLKSVDTGSGLTDDIGAASVSDHMGNIWLSTFDGLNVVDSTLQLIMTIESIEGLVHGEFNRNSVARDGKGNLYFGTVNGMQIIDPEKALGIEKTFGVNFAIRVYTDDHITELEHLDKRLDIYDSADSILIIVNTPDYRNYPNIDDNLYVDSDNLDLEIVKEEAGYLIKNFGSKAFNLFFRNNYKGDVLGQISFNVKSDNRNLYNILSLVGVISLISLIVINLITNYNKRIEENKTELNKRISDLRLTALQSQMNPHFIFNSLGAIQYYIQMHDTEKADDYLGSFASLMRKILESSKSKLITVKDEVDMLQLYLKLEKLRFEEKFNYSLDISKNTNVNANIPPMILQPFIENAINHGLYNLSDRQGKLEVSFEERGRDLYCTIMDNGIGRIKAKKLRSKKHKSRGMQLIYERLDTINRAGNIHVSTETQDLYDDNGQAAGTKVIVKIYNYRDLEYI